MSSPWTGGSDREIPWELESDLPSLASHAAVELDNLIIGRGEHIEAVRRLADVILGLLTPVGEGSALPASFDPATAVIMNHAITDSEVVQARSTTLKELSAQAGHIGYALKEVSDDPALFAGQDRQPLERMRTFCVALSKRASAYEQLLDDTEQSHPFRG